MTNPAHRDELTGLMNRAGLLDVYAKHSAAGEQVVAVHLDLEGFQTINHLHGYEQGDAVLRATADRLRNALPPAASVARVSGDEFIMITPGDRPHGQYISQRIVKDCNEPIALHSGGRASLGVRAGWTCGEANTNSLLCQATVALRDAKDSGGRLASFDEAAAARLAERQQGEIELRAAIVEEQFVLHGQPILDVFEHRVEAIDLMLRWNHPTRGLLSADKFLPIAEESDFIDDIDQWVVGQLCTYAALTHPTLHFSVNLSLRSLSKPSSLRYMLDMLSATGVPTGRLHVDIAQSEQMVDVPAIINSTKQLVENGVGVAIDRFGHGYASLATLTQLSVTAIKLDRSLTAMVDTAEGRGVASAIISFARQRGLRVIAGGVETIEQVETLKELGCRYQQGYYHQRPGALDDILGGLMKPAE